MSALAVTHENRQAELSDHDIQEQAAQHTLAANPLVGVRGQDILDSARVLLGRMVSNPGMAARQYLSFVGELGRIVTGNCELAPEPKDRRFADPAWKESLAYRTLAQCYLAWGGALNRFIDEARMDNRDAERCALRRLAARGRDVANQLARRQSCRAEEGDRHRRREPRARPGEPDRRSCTQRRPAGAGGHTEVRGRQESGNDHGLGGPSR
jgi:hypothetical protein